MGLSGLAQELDLQGIPHVGVGPDPLVGGPAEWPKITLDPEVSVPHSFHPLSSPLFPKSPCSHISVCNLVII